MCKTFQNKGTISEGNEDLNVVNPLKHRFSFRRKMLIITVLNSSKQWFLSMETLDYEMSQIHQYVGSSDGKF